LRVEPFSLIGSTYRYLSVTPTTANGTAETMVWKRQNYLIRMGFLLPAPEASGT
jgi:hypothetical protein